MRHLPGTVLVDGYGTSETGGQGLMPVWPGQTSSELPRFHVDTDTVVLDDAGRPAAPGSGLSGRVARRGRIPIGYHGDDERTASTFPVIDGVRWAIPGDLGRVEGDGSITLLGRGSLSINSGGEKVFPEEVEAVIKAHADVFDAVVIGVPDPRWGEQVTAVVQPRQDRTIGARELITHCRARLAEFKVAPPRRAGPRAPAQAHPASRTWRGLRSVAATRLSGPPAVGSVQCRLSPNGASMEFNLAQVHEAVAEANPDRECIVWRDRRLTYADVTDRTRRLANALRGQRARRPHRERPELAGHESGQDHLALYLHNGNEYLEGMLGACKARVAPFNVNYRYVAEELRYLLNDAEAQGIIFHEAFAPTLAEVLPDLPDLGLLVQVADDSGHGLLPGAVDYEELLADVVSRTGRTSSGRPTTSTSSTPAARPACRRACCGASTTSSSAPWAAGRSARPPSSRTSRRWSRHRRTAVVGPCRLRRSCTAPPSGRSFTSFTGGNTVILQSDDPPPRPGRRLVGGRARTGADPADRR